MNRTPWKPNVCRFGRGLTHLPPAMQSTRYPAITFRLAGALSLVSARGASMAFGGMCDRFAPHLQLVDFVERQGFVGRTSGFCNVEQNHAARQKGDHVHGLR